MKPKSTSRFITCSSSPSVSAANILLLVLQPALIFCNSGNQPSVSNPMPTNKCLKKQSKAIVKVSSFKALQPLASLRNIKQDRAIESSIKPGLIHCAIQQIIGAKRISCNNIGKKMHKNLTFSHKKSLYLNLNKNRRKLAPTRTKIALIGTPSPSILH
jgi:hypothetical protein